MKKDDVNLTVRSKNNDFHAENYDNVVFYSSE
jgi:hypothetical protein